MLDLDLLRSFVSVVDAGGFTRAGERVHRTPSTVSQQIRRLEESFGRPLLHRNGKHIIPTEGSERLLSYARRLLALAEEARDAVSRATDDGVVRLGIPEDFAAYRLTEMLSEFARSRPGLRLSVRCGKSLNLSRALERSELDTRAVEARYRRSWRHCGVARASALDHRPPTSDRLPFRFIAACRVRAGMPLPQPRDYRPRDRGPRLAYRLYEPQRPRNSGGCICRPRY
jgi:DNA-binding transcriptional LysR family regulator